MSPADLRAFYLDRPLTYLRSVPEVLSVELYLPEAGDVSGFDDPDAPALIVQIDLDSADDAEAKSSSDCPGVPFSSTNCCGVLGPDGSSRISLMMISADTSWQISAQSTPVKKSAVFFNKHLEGLLWVM